MSTTFRPERAAEAIRAAVTKILREEVQDPGLGLVTVTACEVSRDLQNAKVFYTVLGDDDARQRAAGAFERAHSFLRSRIGEEVALRTVPEVIFRYDRSTDNALRIEELLAGLPELQQQGDDKPADAAQSQQQQGPTEQGRDKQP
ncbi:MAG TPA: 30S ribosome-binding factor RbfA [Abditibacteriaceae bacterium]|jgi:ribosome-binding factor A